MQTNTTNLHQFRIDMVKRLSKRTDGYEAIELKDMTHKKYFFPEVRGVSRYWEILRSLVPMYNVLITYRKRYRSTGLTLIGSSEDIAKVIKEMTRIIECCEGIAGIYQEKLSVSKKKDEHYAHMVADHKDRTSFMVRQDVMTKAMHLMSKRQTIMDNMNVLYLYVANLQTNLRKVRWQIV